MKAWIISQCAATTDSIQQSLDRLGIQAKVSDCLDSALCAELENEKPIAGPLVFVAMERESDEKFDALRRVRPLVGDELVVVGPSPDHATLLRAMRAGATDYLVSDASLPREIEKLVARVKASGNGHVTKGRLITFVPCNAPCDGSVLAVNMAAVIADRAGTCGLLDLHLRGGDVALLLKLNPRHTVYDLLKIGDGLDDTVFQQALTEHPSGIRLLAGPPMFSDLRGVEPSLCQELLSLARYSHPFVVSNCEDASHAEQLQSLLASDDVVLVIRLDLVSLHRAKHHVNFMLQTGMARSKMHVVAMGTGLRGELAPKTVTSVLGASVHCIPNDPASVTASINVGNPLVLENPRSPASRAIVDLTERITGLRRKSASGAKQPHSFLEMAASALGHVAPIS